MSALSVSGDEAADNGRRTAWWRTLGGDCGAVHHIWRLICLDGRISFVEAVRNRYGPGLARRQDYPIIRFLVIIFHVLAALTLLVGLAFAVYLWIRGELLRDGVVVRGPLADALNRYGSSDLMAGAAVSAAVGLLAFLLLGAIGQFLAMQRDRAINSANQVRLLEDILELNEELGMTTKTKTKRVELCEGCGRLGSLHKIDSGQWICRECRRQIHSIA